METIQHSGSLGARVGEKGVSFRVWAPKAHQIEVVFDNGKAEPLDRDSTGYYYGISAHARVETTYRYRLDGQQAFPDPCSRFQPQGPHGPSQIVDSSSYTWSDQTWPGVQMAGQVIYELHVGAFTKEGTFDAAIEQLDFLKRFGITLLELMPIAECSGRWNWGYDGVFLFAPSHRYGDHEAFKRFVDAAHQKSLGVIVNVFYDHVGPDGNYLPAYSDDYLTDRYPSEWGRAINLDGPGSDGMREFVVQNACYWIEEFHVDGLKVDATQSIHDASDHHILAELSTHARRVAGPRSIVAIAENESQDIRAVWPLEQGGWGLDAMWSNDFPHLTRVAAVLIPHHPLDLTRY